MRLLERNFPTFLLALLMKRRTWFCICIYVDINRFSTSILLRILMKEWSLIHQNRIKTRQQIIKSITITYESRAFVFILEFDFVKSHKSCDTSHICQRNEVHVRSNYIINRSKLRLQIKTISFWPHLDAL